MSLQPAIPQPTISYVWQDYDSFLQLYDGSGKAGGARSGDEGYLPALLAQDLL